MKSSRRNIWRSRENRGLTKSLLRKLTSVSGWRVSRTLVRQAPNMAESFTGMLVWGLTVWRTNSLSRRLVRVSKLSSKMRKSWMSMKSTGARLPNSPGLKITGSTSLRSTSRHCSQTCRVSIHSLIQNPKAFIHLTVSLILLTIAKSVPMPTMTSSSSKKKLSTAVSWWVALWARRLRRGSSRCWLASLGQTTPVRSVL